MDRRPERIRIIHELGKPQSLPAGEDQFDRYGPAILPDRASFCADMLLLGLGPDPAVAAAAVCSVAGPCGPAPDAAAPRKTVHYVECPEFERQMPAHWAAAIPGHWQRISPQQCTPELLARSTTLFYRQNTRLFPSFWGPLLAAAQWEHLRHNTACAAVDAPTPSPASSASPACPTSREKSAKSAESADRTVILPGTEQGLLIRELREAFTDEGWHVLTVPPQDMATTLPRLLAQHSPRLFFSVNFQGLDMFGERHHLLRAAGTEVAAWCVDTPWHILSGCKAPFWKDTHLFVTDDTFLPDLRATGGTDVHHLPLATDPRIFSPSDATAERQHDAPQDHELAQAAVFVGRSEFPERRKYFSGLVPDSALMAKATQMLSTGERPDYHWWTRQLGITGFWPDTPRHAGAGAEEASRRWRALCLEQALPHGLTVFGDQGWHTAVPGLRRLHPPVDYYTRLPAIYRKAGITLNITGLLLPGGLTQRHFDVWAAGGLLLTDANPGMHIFPAHLAQAVTYHRADELPERMAAWRATPDSTKELRSMWRNVILNGHTYRHRVRQVLAAVFAS
ncbi:glycosyltransferase family protein [Desulfovibrio psychrotolerans]|uniref:Spore protein YkvP/CgeB glycosyl transferase-like domain-containing protein n=1 Tax=Desulfovibrio psychrotolerans TaxID=415242 RepID=A0A7J0BW66_9BACT|nr:DUF3880 domain-containing protein [Desulfovibrio psychrotolerans]GFM37405.1 hypothetical protein DSM19430T_20890 [Desulfovibrio psychrotolerans]